MDPQVDHYKVIGLPSGEEGTKLCKKDIRSAYKRKAQELHPDKCRDVDAKEKFQELQVSYEILMDEVTRRKFDNYLRKQQQDKELERFFNKCMAEDEDEEQERSKMQEDIRANNARYRQSVQRNTQVPQPYSEPSPFKFPTYVRYPLYSHIIPATYDEWFASVGIW